MGPFEIVAPRGQHPGPGGPGRSSTVTVVLALLAAWSVTLGSQPIESATERSIKAAYLYKFAAYVEWPEHVFAAATDPLTIGVYGADSLAAELAETTAGRTVDGRPIAVRRVAEAAELGEVHILFISAASGRELPALTAAASAHSVLVVTESRDALEQGSVINFRPVAQRIRFDVSLDSADRNQLRLSARLLAVAAQVQPRRGE